MNFVTLDKQCILCHSMYEITVRPEDVERINNGEHIQDVMPFLSADDRELLISGICGTCFDKTFEEDE